MTEDQEHIAPPLVSGTHHLQRNSYVNAFFLTDELGACATIGKPHHGIPILKGTGVHHNVHSPHLGQFRLPEVVPERAVLRCGHARIEAGLGQNPALIGTHSPRKFEHIIIGVFVAECILGGVEKVLPINKGDCPRANGLGMLGIHELPP